MLCSKYTDLTIPERTKMVGEAVHALMSSNESFTAIRDVIEDAKARGEFDGVSINPETNHDEKN